MTLKIKLFKISLLTGLICTLLSSNSVAKDYSSHILSCAESPDGHHLELEEYTCPLGGEKFQALTLGTHSTFGAYLDFKPISYMDLAIPLPVCPSNGFVLYKRDFTDEEISKIKVIIETQDYKNTFKEKNTSYYLFAKISKELKDPKVDLWGVLLKATWEAHSCGNSEKYKKYATEAIEAAKEELKTTKIQDQNYWFLSFTIPELYRRIGEFEQAKIWVQKIDLSNLQQGEEKDFFILARKLLNKAIKEKNSDPVPVEEKK